MLKDIQNIVVCLWLDAKEQARTGAGSDKEGEEEQGGRWEGWLVSETLRACQWWPKCQMD